MNWKQIECNKLKVSIIIKKKFLYSLTVIYVTKKKETKNNYPLATISMQYVSVDAKS